MFNLAENLENHQPWSAPVPSVLILDDSTFDRKRLVRALRKIPSGFSICEAEDLGQLRDHLVARSFDIVFVDFGLTDGNGLQALKQIQNSEMNRDALTIMVTGNDSAALAVSALKSGFDDFMIKDEICADNIEELIFVKNTLRKGAAPRAVATGLKAVPPDPMQSSPQAGDRGPLEPEMKVALEFAMSRMRMEEMGDSMITLGGWFDEVDHFEFR